MVLAAALTLIAVAPFANTDDPTLGAVELGSHEGWLAPSRFFRRVFDAVSGLGVVDFPIDEWGADVVVSGSQKALMSPRTSA